MEEKELKENELKKTAMQNRKISTKRRRTRASNRKNRILPLSDEKDDAIETEFAPIDQHVVQNDAASEGGSIQDSIEKSSVADDFSKSLLSDLESCADAQKKSLPRKEFLKKLFFKEDRFMLRLSFLLFPILTVGAILISLLITNYLVQLQVFKNNFFFIFFKFLLKI